VLLLLHFDWHFSLDGNLITDVSVFATALVNNTTLQTLEWVLGFIFGCC
jgi:hypothetical protein